MHFQMKDTYDMNDLLEIMAILRSPEGCPWDREQTHQSIRNNFLEEAYEAVEAIDTADTELLKEELGDVLLQIVFHARLEQEAGGFDFSGVADGIAKKLIIRHPHVFGDTAVKNAEEVLVNWEEIKKQTHGRTTDTEVLKGVSAALPALMRTQKVQKKARKALKVDETPETVFSRIFDSAEELKKAALSGSKAEYGTRLGELLFSAVGAAGLLEVEAEQALSDSCERYIARFEAEELKKTEAPDSTHTD